MALVGVHAEFEFGRTSTGGFVATDRNGGSPRQTRADAEFGWTDAAARGCSGTGSGSDSAGFRRGGKSRSAVGEGSALSPTIPAPGAAPTPAPPMPTTSSAMALAPTGTPAAVAPPAPLEFGLTDAHAPDGDASGACALNADPAHAG